MRKDLNKLLCERERRGSDSHFGEFRHMRLFTETKGEEFEDLPCREGMRTRYKVSYHEKEFGENLNPLYGFVRKSVGKKWDDTFSELCEVFNMKSVINRHILEHLWHTVEREVFFDTDGELMYRPYPGYARTVLDENGPEYYVDPITGILKKNPHYLSWRQQNNRRAVSWRQKNQDTEDRKTISKTLELRRRDGVWFACELEEMPLYDIKHYPERIAFDGTVIAARDEQVEAVRYDAWEKTKVNARGVLTNHWFMNRRNRHSGHSINKPGTYVKKVRTASKKELRKYLKVENVQ